ncbi:MAG TPA: hypothetical protein VHG89_06675 [Verrucomicrobiae bacterium]|nr:hypothetical protein [Verrucomicrobiae bacterium]
MLDRQMLDVDYESTFPTGVLGLSFASCQFCNFVFWRAIFAGRLVAARFARKSFGEGAINKSGLGLFSGRKIWLHTFANY